MPNLKNAEQARPIRIQNITRSAVWPIRAASAKPKISTTVSASDTIPENSGVYPEKSRNTSMISGNTRYQRSRTARQGSGHSSFGRPSSLARPASRWTITNAVKKYSSAGISAALQISTYGTLIVSDMMKATAPITGGMIWPPMLEVASTPPAKAGL